MQITVILSFLKIFSLRKATTTFKKKNYISVVFWAFTNELSIIHAATYHFFLTLITVFHMFSIMFPYLYLPFCVFLFVFISAYFDCQETHSHS